MVSQPFQLGQPHRRRASTSGCALRAFPTGSSPSPSASSTRPTRRRCSSAILCAQLTSKSQVSGVLAQRGSLGDMWSPAWRYAGQLEQGRLVADIGVRQPGVVALDPTRSYAMVLQWGDKASNMASSRRRTRRQHAIHPATGVSRHGPRRRRLACSPWRCIAHAAVGACGRNNRLHEGG